MTTPGVIFDLDGVLVRTDQLHERAWSVVLEGLGAHLDHQAAAHLRGLGRMESLGYLLDTYDIEIPHEQQVDIAASKNCLYQTLLETMDPSWVCPGVERLLSGLVAQSVKLAIASSSRNARLILDRLNLAEQFDCIVDGNEITRSKPDPEVFLKAADRLGLAPDRCVAIEDAPSGVRAALDAGMHVLGVGRADDLLGAHKVVETLEEIDAGSLVRI